MVRARRFLYAFSALTLTVLPACDDGVTVQQEDLSVEALAADLAARRDAEELVSDTREGVIDLSRALARLMAGNSDLAPGPSALTSPGREPAAPGVLDYVLVDGPRGSGPPAFQIAEAPLLVGATCIWDVAAVFWKGDPTNKFGTPPSDGVRFELYESETGAPTLPLEPLGSFVDVQPMLQSSEDDGEVRVVVSGKTISDDLLDVLLNGTSDPDLGIFDLVMTGKIGDSGSQNVVDYLFAIDDAQSSNAIEVGDILIGSTLTPPTASIAVARAGSSTESVQFVFTLSSASSIEEGSVNVGGEQVGTMSGSRTSPSFQLNNERFSELSNLQSIYQDVLVLDGRVNELFFFSHCVGADHPSTCALMTSKLGG